MDRKKLVIIIENNMYGDCTIGEFERSVINKTVNEILSLTTDREMEIENTIDGKTDRNVTFHSDGGKEIGRLDFGNDKLTFTGNAEESAKIFIDWLRKFWGKPDREKELEKMVEHEKRRADDLHGRRIYELEAERDELKAALEKLEDDPRHG